MQQKNSIVTSKNQDWKRNTMLYPISTPLPSYEANYSTKSEDSGYENGEFQDHLYTNRKMDTDTCPNILSSSSSSCSPAPKSSSSESRVGSAFSDSPIESEEPVSLGANSVVNDHKNDSVTQLEIEVSESKHAVNDMERAISDLKAENLQLRLDLGVRNDHELASADESLRSVDEEVQEVTPVR